MSVILTIKEAPHQSSSQKKGRSVWWRLHQLAGLQFSLFLSFVFVTGTFAVMSHEIDWLLHPAMWTSPTVESERVSWGTALNTVLDAYPEVTTFSINAPIHSAAPFDVVVADSEGRKHVYVSPNTGKVTGEGPWFNVQRFLRDAHRRIMIFETYKGVRIGILLVCLTSVYLLVSLITSFWVYKKWWRGFFRFPRGKNMRVFIGDLHRWIGIWTLWFIAVMSYTGIWYLQAELLPYGPYPSQQHTEGDLSGANSSALSMGDALDLAIVNSGAVHSEFRIKNVYIEDPESSTPVFRIHGETDKALLVDPRGNAVWASAQTGVLLASRDASTFNGVDRLYIANNPLHFGTFGGYTTKWLYFIFGLLLSGLSVSGVLIYVSRLAIQEKISGGTKYFLKNSWRSMGYARWPALALTVFSFIAFPLLIV
jgi:uncharacterized iron-regulated membrane protein